MTAQEIIENAMLRIEDTDPSGRTKVQLLSYLNTFYRSMYNFIMSWDIDNVASFTKTRLAFTVDSEGKYALPSDHLRTTHLFLTGYERPAKYVAYSVMENSTYGVAVNEYRWSLYNNYWYVAPVPSVGAIAWYYPKISTLALADTWPGDGEFDDAAIEFLVTKCLLNDRFGKYDVQAEASDYAAAMLRSRMSALRRDPRTRVVASPIHSYKAARL